MGRGRDASRPLGEVEVQATYWAFCVSTLGREEDRVGCFIMASGRGKSRLPSSLGGSEATMFCVWYLAIVKWLLSKSFLSFETAPFLVYLLERVNFYWHFFRSASIGVSRLLVSSPPCLRIYEAKRKPVNSPLYHS